MGGHNSDQASGRRQSQARRNWVLVSFKAGGDLVFAFQCRADEQRDYEDIAQAFVQDLGATLQKDIEGPYSSVREFLVDGIEVILWFDGDGVTFYPKKSEDIRNCEKIAQSLESALNNRFPSP
jgi:hypothetical protein